MRVIICLILMVTSLSLQAQNVDYFEEKESELTDVFISSSELRKKSIDDRYTKITRSKGLLIKGLVHEGSNFTQTLHKSGMVIFNCEANEYLNTIKDNLLKDYPELSKKIKIYITKNSTLNAFATINNAIYVNVGLLARIENEAQLAYILSHELMHIVNAHIIKGSLKVNEKFDHFDRSDITSKEDMVQLYRHSVSRDHECQADADGLTLYLKQGYSPKESINALQLLDDANSLLTDPTINHSLLFFNDSSELDIWSKMLQSYKPDSTKLAKPEDDNLKTHPDVSIRIKKIKKLLEETPSDNENIKYLLDQKVFDDICSQSRNYLHKLLAMEQNYLSLFVSASNSYINQGDTSASNINCLGYALQGLTFDKLILQSSYDIENENYCSAEKLLAYYYENSNSSNFAKWALNTMDNIDLRNHTTTTNDYLEIIREMVGEIDSEDLTESAVSDSTNLIEENKNEPHAKMVFSEIPFEIYPYVDLTKRKLKEFNTCLGRGNYEEGKIALVGMHNIHIRKVGKLANSRFELDLHKLDKLNIRSLKGWKKIEQLYPELIVTLMPNENNYSSKDLVNYITAKNWLEENFYFEENNFLSLNQKELDVMREEEGIRYLFLTLNIEITAFSMAKFYLAYFAPFVTSFYMPQLITDLVMASTRKYQLSVIYDTKNGELVFWDTRTHQEPNITSQFALTYDSIISNFINE